MGAPRIPIADRFWPKVDKSGGDDGCWLWTGKVTPNGYGQVRVGYGADRRTAYVHRLAAEWAGIDVSGHVHHVCGTKLCVNPRHLEGVTTHQHMREHKSPLTAAAADAIRKRIGERLADIADEFGVSRSTVCAIQRGRTWA